MVNYIYGAVMIWATFRFNAGAGKFGAAYAQVFTWIKLLPQMLEILNLKLKLKLKFGAAYAQVFT